jgi:hypothetical protein
LAAVIVLLHSMVPHHHHEIGQDLTCTELSHESENWLSILSDFFDLDLGVEHLDFFSVNLNVLFFFFVLLPSIGVFFFVFILQKFSKQVFIHWLLIPLNIRHLKAHILRGPPSMA